MRRTPKLLMGMVLVLLTATLFISLTAYSDESDAITTQNFIIDEGVNVLLPGYTTNTLDYYITNGVLPPGITIHMESGWTVIGGTPTKPGIWTVALTVYGETGQTDRIISLLVREKVTFHNADGTTTAGWYSPYFPHYAPGGTATSGQTFCGWNTQSDGKGITYLENSVVPFGIKDLYAQQSSSPITLTFNHSFTLSPITAYTRGVISGQDVMLPISTNVTHRSTTSSVKAEIGFNTVKAGTGDMYLIGEPAQFTANKTLYGQQATTDSSRTVVIVGMAAYYVPRGETFEFGYIGVPCSSSGSGFPAINLAPYATSSSDIVNTGFTMTANANVILIQQGTSTAGPYAVSVTYMPNGGTGDMRSIATGSNASTTTFKNTKAQQCAFTPPAGKMFKTWHIGSLTGPTLSPGGIVTGMGYNINLYAEWMDIPPDPVYVITYDANGGTGTITPSTVVQGQPYTVTSQSFSTPNQQSFVGWGLQGTSTVYDPGDIFTPTSDITLVAIWQWDFFFVNLIPNGAPGDTINLTSPGDVSIIMPSNPFTWSGHVFAGWQVNNNEPTLSIGYEFWPQGNINLYAQWIDTSDPIITLPEIPLEWIAIGILAFLLILILIVVVFRDD